MKKSWLLLFLLIIVVSISGCSTTPSSIISENKEIAHAQFCVGNVGNITFEPPLVLDQINGGPDTVFMPIEPGRYKITVTTSTPDAAVYVTVAYKELKGYDKFGNPSYGGDAPWQSDHWASRGPSNAKADFNTEILIPDSSIDGHISISNNLGMASKSHNCGTLIVTRLTV